MTKTLQEQTIKNEFLFGAVMSDEENCRLLLERILEFPIASIKVDREKSMIYHPEYHGIRLDIYAKDENNTHYNIEMQVIGRSGLEKRARYYHSQMDMNLLLSGTDYKGLPQAYVIFVCDFDPFQEKKYRYTYEGICRETGEVLDDGSRTIFLSTHGTNREEVSAELIKFLEYVRAELPESEQDFEDGFVNRLQKTVAQIKNDREMGARYMLLEELLSDKRAEGQIETALNFLFDLIQELGGVSFELQEMIMKEQDMEVLKRYYKIAARATSIEEFIEKIK